MENKKEKENRQALKWVYLFASIVMFILTYSSLTPYNFKDYTGSTTILFLFGILFLSLWYSVLNSPSSSESIKTPSKSELDAITASMGGADGRPDKKTTNTKRQRDYLLDNQEKMKDEDIAAYLKSKNEGI